MLAEHTRAFQRDGGTAAVVICAWRGIGGVLIAVIARVVMPRYQIHPLGLSWICAFQDGIDILDFGRLLDAVIGTLGLLNKSVSLDFQTAVAVRGDFFKFRLDPVAGSYNALRSGVSAGVIDGKRATRAKADQFLVSLLHALG